MPSPSGSPPPGAAAAPYDRSEPPPPRGRRPSSFGSAEAPTGTAASAAERDAVDDAEGSRGGPFPSSPSSLGIPCIAAAVRKSLARTARCGAAAGGYVDVDRSARAAATTAATDGGAPSDARRRPPPRPSAAASHPPSAEGGERAASPATSASEGTAATTTESSPLEESLAGPMGIALPPRRWHSEGGSDSDSDSMFSSEVTLPPPVVLHVAATAAAVAADKSDFLAAETDGSSSVGSGRSCDFTSWGPAHEGGGADADTDASGSERGMPAPPGKVQEPEKGGNRRKKRVVALVVALALAALVAILALFLSSRQPPGGSSGSATSSASQGGDQVGASDDSDPDIGVQDSGGAADSMSPTHSPQQPASWPSGSPSPRPNGGEADTHVRVEDSAPSVSRPAAYPTVRPSKEPVPRPTDAVVSNTAPTLEPTATPTTWPSKGPTGAPMAAPSAGPTKGPTSVPSGNPTSAPTTAPMAAPKITITWDFVSTSTMTQEPASGPTAGPSRSPAQPPAEEGAGQQDAAGATYVPGDLTVQKEGLLLSKGLDVRVIARSGQAVRKADGSQSRAKFHFRPDAGATFAVPETDQSNPGGWVYVNNAEVWEPKQGGVGAIEFDWDGRVLDYKMVLTNTTGNCGGGKTPWGTWISCEELPDWGHCYEVDPFNWAPPRRTSLSGGIGGGFESVAVDARDSARPRFFVTEDTEDGALRRYTPRDVDWNNPSEMLHGEGTLEYLVLSPQVGDPNQGTFRWTADKNAAKASAGAHYPFTEGIDFIGSELYFVCKTAKELFILDLDKMTYKKSSTVRGVFDGDPDQLVRLIENANIDSRGILYFTEDLGVHAGVHGRDSSGRYFTIFESPVFQEDETTGLAFSPDARHMYVAYQENGILFDVFRTDGLPFTGQKIDIKYHSTGQR